MGHKNGWYILIICVVSLICFSISIECIKVFLHFLCKNRSEIFSIIVIPTTPNKICLRVLKVYVSGPVWFEKMKITQNQPSGPSGWGGAAEVNPTRWSSTQRWKTTLIAPHYYPRLSPRCLAMLKSLQMRYVKGGSSK